MGGILLKVRAGRKDLLADERVAGGCIEQRLGLGIIRERAQAIGATSQIESQPGCGTQLVVVWKEDE